MPQKTPLTYKAFDKATSLVNSFEDNPFIGLGLLFSSLVAFYLAFSLSFPFLLSHVHFPR